MSNARRIRLLFIAVSLLVLVASFAWHAAAEEAADASGDIANTDEPKSRATPVAAPDSSVEEILVTGTSVSDAIDQARFSESIVDVLSAKDFAVTGDTGVVDALARVTGVTTVGDKYVYVRGLGERYSSTQFNGALLPSPDPVRRVVPLDLFPAGVMEQLSVQKTYAPYLPAEFSGGSVQLRTRGVPSQREARMSLSSEYRAGTTFTNRDWQNGSGWDWSGYDGGYRDLPGDMPDAIDGLNAMTTEQRQAIGLELNRKFDTGKQTLPPNFKLKGSYGDDFDLHIGNVGFLLGWQADNKWLHALKQRATSSGVPGLAQNHSREDNTTNTMEYSGLGAAQWKPSENHTIGATLFYTHNTDKRFITENGYLAENQHWVSDITSEWEEQSLWTTQLEGTHNLPKLHDLGIDWGLTYASASRLKPDTRFYRYDVPSDPLEPERDPQFGSKILSPDVNGNERDWENLTDNAWDAHLDGELPLRLSDQIASTLRFGARYFDKQRDSQFRRFRYVLNGNHKWDDYGYLPIDQVFSDPNIAPGFWDLREATSFFDQYKGEEEIIAGFVQTETELGSKLRLMVGTRYETSSQTIELPYTQQNWALDNAGFRPAVELTWLLREDLQLRGAFSQTLNRPDLREISPAYFINPEDRLWYHGNPALKVAQITNYDLRLEWYHSGADHMQLAAFYKDIADPIEQILEPSGNKQTWANSKNAALYGTEFELRQGLSPLGRWAEDFYVRSNAAYIHSMAQSDIPTLTNKRHALQGQSPWIVNFQLTWENLPSDTDATVAFNMSGKYIKNLGSTGFEDSYVQPKPSLDFVLRHGLRFFGEDLDLTFKARNLLDPKYEVIRAGVSELSYRSGSTFSIEIGKDF